MTALAAVTDVEAVARPVPDGDTARVQRLLEMVSAAVRSYTRQTFDRVVDDTVIVYPDDGQVRLPQRPVTAVSSVSQNGSALTAGSWSFDASGVLRRSVTWWAGDEQPWLSGPLNVTYTHGYASIPDGLPDDLRMVVAQRAAGMWNADPDGARSETIGSYSITRDPGAGWDVDQKAVLDRYRSRPRSLRLVT